MTAPDELLQVCDQIPGLLRGAVVLVPEGIVVAHFGTARESDVDPLVRATMRCVKSPGNVVEYTLVSTESILVIELVHATTRFALAAECAHGANLALVMTATRHAAAAFEGSFDFTAWESA